MWNQNMTPSNVNKASDSCQDFSKWHMKHLVHHQSLSDPIDTWRMPHVTILPQLLADTWILPQKFWVNLSIYHWNVNHLWAFHSWEKIGGVLATERSNLQESPRWWIGLWWRKLDPALVVPEGTKPSQMMVFQMMPHYRSVLKCGYTRKKKQTRQKSKSSQAKWLKSKKPSQVSHAKEVDTQEPLLHQKPFHHMWHSGHAFKDRSQTFIKRAVLLLGAATTTAKLPSERGPTFGPAHPVQKVHKQSTPVWDDQRFETTYRTSKAHAHFPKMRPVVGSTALLSEAGSWNVRLLPSMFWGQLRELLFSLQNDSLNVRGCVAR